MSKVWAVKVYIHTSCFFPFVAHYAVRFLLLPSPPSPPSLPRFLSFHFFPSPPLRKSSMATAHQSWKQKVGPATDLRKWRLVNRLGRQTWYYDENNQSGRDSNFIERHALGLELVTASLWQSCGHVCGDVYLCMYMYVCVCVHASAQLEYVSTRVMCVHM